MSDNITVLPSVYKQRNGEYIENKLFWSDLTKQGKQLYILNEMKHFSQNDFTSDRFYIFSFIDRYELWVKFECAKEAINIIPSTYDNADADKTYIHDIKDWFDDAPAFSFEIFCSLLNSLNMLPEFFKFMLNECEELEKERSECGYPLIVPENIKFELLGHINRKRF
jgi:hypothetical protein